MREKEDKTKEIQAIEAAKKANRAAEDEDVIFLSTTECVIIPEDFPDYQSLVINMILNNKLCDADLTELFDYMITSDDSEEACKLYICDRYEYR